MGEETRAVIIKGKGAKADSWVARYLDAFPAAAVWTLNDDRHPRATRHFEMHRPRHHTTLDLHAIPVSIHWDETPAEPNEEPFPMVEVRKRFPGIYDFSSSVSYMLVLAAIGGATDVCLPGCNFTGNQREFSEERHSAEKWACALIGAGVRLHLPDTSALLSKVEYYA